MLPPELPAPALATVDRLTAGGELWTLRRREYGGMTVYDITAKVHGKDVRYEIASDGTVLATGIERESEAVSDLVEEGETVRRTDES